MPVSITNPRVWAMMCLVLLATPSLSYAVPLMLDAGSDPVRNNGSSNFGGIIGYRFTLDADNHFLTRLGMWDGPGTAASPSSGSVGDGLEESALVGLWRESDMTLLSSATIPVGAAAPLMDAFRYVPVDAIELDSGVGYVLGALVSSGGNAFLNGFESPAGTTEFSDIISGPDGRFLASVSLVFPTSDSSNADLDAFVGPNAILAPIPEPASSLPILLGIAGLCRVAARRRRAAREP